MINGYIIEKFNNMTGAYTCNRIVEEATKRGVKLRLIGVHDTVIGGDGVYNHGECLAPVDFVLNRYKWGKVKDAISGLGSRSYNELEAFSLYTNKYEQLKNLHSDGCLFPEYLVGTCLADFNEIQEKLGLPFVAKGLESSMGQEIYLVEKESDFVKLSEFGMQKEWLFEEYISSSFGRDMRVYTIRGEVVAAMERRSKGDFRANVALGASATAITITEDMRIVARDIYEETGLDFLGIDLLYGEDKPYFCEINVMPGLEGIEGASGINIAGKLIDTILGDFACQN